MRLPPDLIPPRLTATAIVFGVAIGLGGCSSNSPSPSMPVSGTFDYQLGGPYDSLPGSADSGEGGSSVRASSEEKPSPSGGAAASTDPEGRIDIVVRDAGAAPLHGAYSVCYVNGFQNQPDEAARWRDHDDLLLHDAAGDVVVDPDWPDERILDPSTADRRSQILDIIGPVIDGCARSGYAAVEIDNLDTSDRFPDLDRTGALALAAAYVDRAHAHGLSIAQKNAAELAKTAHSQLGFDFAVTEECAAFDECDRFTSVYGDRVLAIEYPDTLAEAGLDFADACSVPDRPPLMILRDRDLVAAGEHGYRYDTC